MTSYIVLFLGSCLLASFITPLLRRAAIKNDILDYPNERKLHTQAVPRVGGVAIVISFFISMALGYMLFRDELDKSAAHLAGLSISAIVISLIGIWDDFWVLSARRKLVGQVIAVLALMPFGFFIDELNIPFVGVVEVGWQLGVPLALFWIVGIINTINFIDGMDGLAAGVVIAISSALFVVSAVTDQLLMAAICLILVGSTLGFLVYNFHPASIFMGDCGAMFLGFMLAAISVKVLFQNSSVAASSFVPVLILGLPIVDTVWTIVRRLKRRESPLHADKSHTHHRLINVGLTQRQAAVALYAVSLLSASAGIAIVLANSERLAVIVSAVMLAVALTGVFILSRAAPPSERQEA